ncbi:hypothetical protein BO83DRAFT_380345 [Aspergillus eucalypticola CBS 122712]|uniref:Uncharacterized protein n=1 Tax=Aspergillus eucalypticola (strain CBS 122712 / IBT 29274) TaxID=1448314 RepID=A0A317V3R2_ASPEC|nr:uncharacterized protein BO83DRAFT_380345 [Aspergillus eucalypticola CBS 122712]PWY67688.1 hypothetical protein BO83DRAFT_380345 [Aspergillus eucalypticola CBS 122712]
MPWTPVATNARLVFGLQFCSHSSVAPVTLAHGATGDESITKRRGPKRGLAHTEYPGSTSRQHSLMPFHSGKKKEGKN